MPNIRPLSSELQEIAKKELGEDPNRVEKDLEHIKEWLKKQPHLKTRTDDQFLIAFLRGCKFSLERTKEKLDMFYTMRTALPEYFSKRDPMDPEIQEVLKLGLLVPLPVLDGQGRRVLLQRMGGYDPAKISVQAIVQSNFLFWDIMMQEDDAGMVKGYVGFSDMKGATVAHAMQFTPSMMRKTMTCFNEAYPIRIKAMHYLNVHPIFDKLFQFASQFMKEKMKRRIHMHGGNLESIYEHIPKSVLPKDYGGDGPSLDELASDWKKKVESYRDYFLEDSKYCSNEKKRPGKPKSSEDLFGLEGSFRQLTFD
ncbi:retinol-binding protein pinta-like isoform X2 [Anabrus simplex]|uniref:retinol-binding protein pinta-like isoform X2 n=1 Tax=Anabrus simplex TaxID=316456 RepID=UPI0035A362B5